MVSDKTIGRLSQYRRLLMILSNDGTGYIYSHELARLSGNSAAQIRRDLMAIRTNGNARKGYKIDELIAAIGTFLDAPAGPRAVLVGVGNLGKALLAYFREGRRANFHIAAAFDKQKDKVDRVIHGCRCYPLGKVGTVVRKQQIRIGIVTVPAAAAQEVTDRLVEAGVRGLLNFAPVALRVSPEIYVETIDMTTSLETVAYFANRPRADRPFGKA